MNTVIRFQLRGARRWSALTLALVALPLSATPATEAQLCKHSAHAAWLGCRREAAGDFWLQRAKCLNLATAQERWECTTDALAELFDAVDECGGQRQARLDLCDDLGGGVYQPVIDPDDFVELVDNPYHPLIPGTSFRYEKVTPEATEVVEIVVTHETKEILGVECTVVHSIESIGDEVQEDTFDWFAQDQWGNVWYFGELSMSFEDGELAGLGGSWKAGEDGALPGILMLADPEVGDLYRQEFLLGEAEAVAAVLSLNASASVPYGAFQGCLKTMDFTPLEPDALEHKFYAPGIGLVLEFDPESGERVELISVDTE